MYIYIYMYITRLPSNEVFSPSKKIHREVGWAKDLSAPRYIQIDYYGTYLLPTEDRYGFRVFLTAYSNEPATVKACIAV